MAVYMVSYDLNSEGKDYKKIIGAINLLDPSNYHILKSQWLVSSKTLNASQIREHLQKAIDTNDDLVVFQIANNYSGYIKNSEKLKAWIDARL